jgi:8-oxo-dGTP diphosphatase
MTINKLIDSNSLHRMPVAVDLIILTVQQSQLCALLIRRGIKPFMGQWALPGGFIREGESLEAAAWRELEEETGVKAAKVGHMEQLATFGAPKRDPRERVISVAYLAFVPDLPAPKAGGDAHEACIVPIAQIESELKKLAFDHTDILQLGIERTRSKLEYTSLATSFCPTKFTIHQLRAVYEAVWGIELDPANFHRKVTKTIGFVEPTKEAVQGGSGRPAAVFIKGEAVVLYPPLLRAERDYSPVSQ